MTFRYWPQFKSTSIALAVSTALVGCGGGDSSSSAVPDTPVTPPTSTKQPVNVPPTLAISAPERQSEGSIVSIRVEAKDAEDDKLDIRWGQKSGPAVPLTKVNDTLNFEAPDVQQEETLVFEVSVNDGHNSAVKQEVAVTVYPFGAKPTVVVSQNGEVDGGHNFELVGSATDDGEVVSLAWEQVIVGEEPTVELIVGETGKATFATPNVGHNPPVELTFKLSATDNEGFVSTETQLVTVRPLPPEVAASALGNHPGGVEIAMPLVVTSYADPATLTYKWEQVGVGPAVWLKDTETPQATAVVPYSNTIADIAIRATATDAFGRSASAEFTLTVEPTDRPAPEGDLILNDTGANLCANDASDIIVAPIPGGGPVEFKDNNRVDCTLLTDDEGLSIPANQDGHFGRDVLAKEGRLAKVGSGRAGFDFSKLDNEGNALPVSATEWDCVKDNHTGLIWQVKSDKTGLHDNTNTYTWYNPDPTRNGGNEGLQNGGYCSGSDCDTKAYVEATNAAGYCGINTWSLPTFYQLISIADFGAEKNTAMIDTDFFPDTKDGTYWTSQATRGQYQYPSHVGNIVKVFHFYEGIPDYFKDNKNYIRLVAKPEQNAGGEQ
ncbi:hypothetical protein VIBNISOn1_280028 [Vibrio nigripulchritudo SOn1]|uniref:Lcl C-terminal domain-containing protein n=1 Tax=Vibrio nigripulchritudo SOn1 TaxID=1238450 RepID=A0AAV2VRH8_9VIBR|nr:DUF1566 domain-containing protein [Vibrio nigripulchritudo]CCO47259.1 hypothetical protein VIBNISOn1_280028 [Vibrio nigripulchritudo SOn1]